MPKTAVDKNSQLLLWKNEVWFAGQRLMSSPACDVMFLEQFEQLEFGGPVALAANAGHHLTALGFIENVCHFFSRTAKKNHEDSCVHNQNRNIAMNLGGEVR